jgi:hypothetical protein
VAVCVAKRKGRKPVTARFSVEDAKRAGLWGKQGPWSAYPKRMMQMRARGFALRDAFPDVLKGMITAEEAQDYPSDVYRKRLSIRYKPNQPTRSTLSPHHSLSPSRNRSRRPWLTQWSLLDNRSCRAGDSDCCGRTTAYRSGC